MQQIKAFSISLFFKNVRRDAKADQIKWPNIAKKNFDLYSILS